MSLTTSRENTGKKLRKSKNRVLSGKKQQGIIFIGVRNAVY